MGLVAAETLAGRVYVTRPNHSLSANGSVVLFLVAAAVSGIIAIAFSLFGAWPVMPFAGIELAVLWWALRRTEAHAGDFEKITLEPDRLTVEKRNGAHVERYEFHPYWTQLEYLQNARRLLLRSRGQAIEVGNALTEEEQLVFAKELKQKLGPQQPQ